ncbi:WD40-repeat-containing domain protein [Fimicolochytrium jonesii]|uniref:WD40-repeat-containing domain protein n=1 Tax=Fimicolochytrium jonesii TaxID=1396493 RepID=UPI0022FED529|nr:WD40-repeat-containing domain protein [Fimicolochytrium jonesii]KAI8827223.1 WD40-repeat-containing domain protein [Fimicolochytrium jonesii]
MISSLLWVRKGAAQEKPDKFKLTEEEFSKVAEKIGARLDDAREDLQVAGKGSDNDDEDEMAVDEPTDAEKAAAANGEDDELAEYNLDNYDDDSEEEKEADGLESVNIPLFSKIQGLTFHGSNEEDPYVSVQDDVDEEEEMNEMTILPGDNLLLAAKTEDDISHLEVYVYEEVEDNLYVHHDIMLPSFPLCLEWMDFRVGSKKDLGTPGNYVAIGTFDPEVEIWDLDTVDAVYPECVLGESSSASQSLSSGDGGKKKKKKFGPGRTAKSANPYTHVDAVMAISWNSKARNLIATGSADTTVKLWDLGGSSTAKAVRSFSQHKDKVQAVAWNPAEPTVLLTGGYDKRCCAFDSRAPNAVTEFKLRADVECVKWDPWHSERFFVSTEDGLVQCFDARNNASQAVFTLHAHDAAVSAMDISSQVEGLLVTGSTDKMVKVWNIKESRPSCLVSRDLDLGRVFATTFSPDAPYTIAAAGSKGKVLVWNLENNAGVRRAFNAKRSDAEAEVAAPPRKEITGVESDGEGEEDEDEEEGVPMEGGEGMEVDDDEEESDEDHV